MTIKPIIRSLAIAVVFAVTVSFLYPALQEDAENNSLEKIDTLIKEKKYLSAAEYIGADQGLMEKPAFFMKYINILTDYYAYTINGMIFAMKDLTPEERIEDIRGKQGSYQMIGRNVEKLIADKFKKYPDSPEIQFAVGKYLSFRDICCGNYGEDSPFINPRKQEYDSFKFAYNHQVFTWFSLFRMGFLVLSTQSEPVSQAIDYFRKAYALNPEHLDTSYNLALAYMQDDKREEALECIDRVVGRYGDKNLNADSYHVKGSILYSRDRKKEAIDFYRKALEETAAHPGAFKDLLQSYREAGMKQEYISLVLENLARNYANPLFLNYYVDFLRDHGVQAVDDELEQKIEALPTATEEATGAIYFNLGKLSLIKSNKDKAVERFQKARASFSQMPSPPPHAIESIDSILKQIQ
jgi:tetratricopeptide (TPR) repeat protein